MGTWFWINVPLMVLAFALTPASPTRCCSAAAARPPPPPRPGLHPPRPSEAPAVAAARTVRTRPAAA